MQNAQRERNVKGCGCGISGSVFALSIAAYGAVSLVTFESCRLWEFDNVNTFNCFWLTEDLLRCVLFARNTFSYKAVPNELSICTH